jgi:hypothetical protein
VIFEMRTYTVRPGRLPEYLADFEARGLPVISRYARLVAYWVSEVGPLNEVVHVWAYESAAHRAAQRAKLYADPEWTGGYLPTGVEHVLGQQSRLLTAAPFSPIGP